VSFLPDLFVKTTGKNRVSVQLNTDKISILVGQSKGSDENILGVRQINAM
jgi:hypothetical protein